MKRVLWIAVTLMSLATLTAVAAQVRNKIGGGYIVYPTTNPKHGPVVFSHLSHCAGGAGFSCDDCHPTIAKKKWAITKDDVHHGMACASCHNGEKKAPKTGQVAHKISECSACHMPRETSTIIVDSIGNVPFSHTKHTGAVVNGKVVEYGGQACGDCHEGLYARKNGLSVAMTYPHGNDSCGACHDGETVSPSGKTAFTVSAGNCRKCHIEPKEGQAGQPPCRPYSARTGVSDGT
jgi:c(7)-type cytochrome triheme protein